MTTALELMYDGDCGLCRACVRWIERHDTSKVISCAPAATCTWDDASTLPFDQTVVVRDVNGVTYLRSSAVARSLKELPGPWGLFGSAILGINSVTPFKALNDFLYHQVGKNRRHISNALVRLGLLDASCRMPAPSKD